MLHLAGPMTVPPPDSLAYSYDSVASVASPRSPADIAMPLLVGVLLLLAWEWWFRYRERERGR